MYTAQVKYVAHYASLVQLNVITYEYTKCTVKISHYVYLMQLETYAQLVG
jgi:hypothetical protein